MGKGYTCGICGRTFSSSNAVVEHIKSQHAGKLSDSSIEWLLKQGVKPNRIVEWCKKNRVKVDESKIWKIARKMMKRRGK